MNEFLKLSWRNTEDTQNEFLNDEDVAGLYTYKSLTKPLKRLKKKVKLHLGDKKYVPGLAYYRKINNKSLLTKIQKCHCLEALKLIQSGKKQDLLTQKEKYSLKIYKGCQSKIVEENRIFNEFVQNIWLKNQQRRVTAKPWVYSFSWNRWKEKSERYLEYPQFYKEVETLSLNFDENEATIDFQHIVQPLETGTLARYARSNLKEQCILKINSLRKLAKPELVNSRMPISQDGNITKLAENYNFDVVISSSSLKQLMDFTNIKTKWMIPVAIRETVVEKDRTTHKKKIVFIDKVLPKVNPSVSDLQNYAYKRLLKLNFCKYEAFRYPVEETPLETSGKEKNENEDKEAPEEDLRNEDLVIHHNVNYRIWNIKKTAIQNTLLKNQAKDREINLLVRCKLDGCEDSEQGVLYPVIIRPKIEQQLQYGVNICSKSELSRDWTDLFFRLYSVLYRTRIYSPKNEVISVEKCSIQKVTMEAHTHYEFKPILGLGILQKILSHLMDLECGSYLLQHLPKQEAFISVMKQTDETGSSYDLHKEYENVKMDATAKPNWLPIDVNYILPAHEEFKTIPGLFHGFDNIDRSKVPRNKRKSKRKRKNPQ